MILHTLHLILHTLHFTLNTLHFTLHTSHCTLDIPNFTHHALHLALHTPHSTLYTSHSTLHTWGSTLCTLHSTLYTPHLTLYTLHFTFHTLHCTLDTSHCTIPALYPTLHSPLNTPLSLRPTLCTPPHSTLHSRHLHGNTGKMYDTGEITCFTKVFYLTAFGFVGCILFSLKTQIQAQCTYCPHIVSCNMVIWMNMAIFFKHMAFIFGSLVTPFNQQSCFNHHSLQNTTAKLLQFAGRGPCWSLKHGWFSLILTDKTCY